MRGAGLARASSFSATRLSTLQSLVLEVAFEDAKQMSSNSDEIDDYEMKLDEYERISQLPGNDHCADCSSQDTEWASVTYGILLCAECSGIHR